MPEETDIRGCPYALQVIVPTLTIDLIDIMNN